MQDFQFEALTKSHNRIDFNCGITALNNFLRSYALQNQKKNVVRTYVIHKNMSVIAYYSLVFSEVQQAIIPEWFSKGVGQYPVPAITLARLAIDVHEQGKGLGKALLKHALYQAQQASKIAGLRVMIVQAKDISASNFYKKYGFIECMNDPYMLFYPISFIEEKK